MKKLLDKYDFFFFDLWGVIYDGKKIYKEILKIFKLLNNENKKIVIITNSSKSKIETYKFLKEKGIKKDLIHNIFTSGDYAKHKLLNSKKKMFIINGNSKKNINFTKRLKLKVVNDYKEADCALAITFNKNFSSNKIIKNMKLCNKAKLKLYCINPDFIDVNLNRGMGYYLNKYLNLGSIVEYYGKPNIKYFEYIFSELKLKSKKKILFIGDTIYNDIVGANYFGIDSLLVKKSKLYKIKNKNFKLLKTKKKNLFKPKYTVDELQLN